MACRRAPLTTEQLRAAWVVRRRADWPTTFDAAMADPLLQRLVRCMAMGMAQAATRRSATARPAPTRRPAPPQPQPQHQPLDRKRLAAGERDDD